MITKYLAWILACNNLWCWWFFSENKSLWSDSEIWWQGAKKSLGKAATKANVMYLINLRCILAISKMCWGDLTRGHITIFLKEVQICLYGVIWDQPKLFSYQTVILSEIFSSETNSFGKRTLWTSLKYGLHSNLNIYL